MSYKKLGLIVLGVLAVIICILIYIRDNVIEQAHPALDITDLSETYAATVEIAKATAEREKPDAQPAEVVTALPPDLPVMALIFDGLPERPLTLRLLDVLEKHKVPAVFFVEGDNAANQPETLTAIHDAGQEIGNYTFVGLAGIEKQPVEEQLLQICRAQKAILVMADTIPQFFRAPRIRYDDNILKSVKAAGIPYGVKENVWFRPEAAETPESALTYAASIPMGSILAVRIARVVEPKADTPVKEESTPATDMKPTIKDDVAPKVPAGAADLADRLDWVLTALEGRGIQFAPLHQFRKIHYIPAPTVPNPTPAPNPNPTLGR